MKLRSQLRGVPNARPHQVEPRTFELDQTENTPRSPHRHLQLATVTDFLLSESLINQLDLDRVSFLSRTYKFFVNNIYKHSPFVSKNPLTFAL